MIHVLEIDAGATLHPLILENLDGWRLRFQMYCADVSRTRGNIRIHGNFYFTCRKVSSQIFKRASFPCPSPGEGPEDTVRPWAQVLLCGAGVQVEARSSITESVSMFSECRPDLGPIGLTSDRKGVILYF